MAEVIIAGFGACADCEAQLRAAFPAAWPPQVKLLPSELYDGRCEQHHQQRQQPHQNAAAALATDAQCDACIKLKPAEAVIPIALWGEQEPVRLCPECISNAAMDHHVGCWRCGNVAGCADCGAG